MNCWCLPGAQVYDYIMQSLAKYRAMYMDMAALMRSGQPAPDLHAHHDLLASHLPANSSQVPSRILFPDLHSAVAPCIRALWRMFCIWCLFCDSAERPAVSFFRNGNYWVGDQMGLSDFVSQGIGRDGYGPDGSGGDGRGSEDTFNMKLKTIVDADYTELALAAGPLDIAGQVSPYSHRCTSLGSLGARYNHAHPARPAGLRRWVTAKVPPPHWEPLVSLQASVCAADASTDWTRAVRGRDG